MDAFPTGSPSFKRGASFKLKGRTSVAAAPIVTKRISDPQTRELTAVFDYLDSDGDGKIDLAQAISLCRQLGFNVDKKSLHCMPEQVTVRQVLSWCEAFLEACASDSDLLLTQMYMLLQAGDTSPRIGVDQMYRYFQAQHVACTPRQVADLVTEIEVWADRPSDESSVRARPARRTKGFANVSLTEDAFKTFMRDYLLKQAQQEGERLSGALGPLA